MYFCLSNSGNGAFLKLRIDEKINKYLISLYRFSGGVTTSRNCVLLLDMFLTECVRPELK